MKLMIFIKRILREEKEGLLRFQTARQEYSPELEKKVELKIAENNVKRLIPFAAIILLIEIINQITIFLTSSGDSLQAAYLPAGILMILLMAVSILLSYLALRRSFVTAGRCRLLYRSFWWLFSLGMLVFILLEISTRGSTNNFIYLLILTAAFPLLTWKESILLFCADTAVTFSFALYRGLTPQQLLQFPLIAIFAWILSRMLYSSYKMNEIMLAQLKISNQKLADLARTDPLTGLFNRRGIQEQLQIILSRFEHPVRTGFLMIDIDLFKKYNDRFGHEQGDQCLKKVADTVKSCTKGPYDITSRFGGEEFLVALIDHSQEEIFRIAEQILSEILALKLPAADDEVSSFVTVSIGAASVMAPFDFITLYEQADHALYRAKKSGRNCVTMYRKSGLNGQWTGN